MSAADTLLEYIERREQVAAQRERAAIVAWLRSVGSRSMSTWPDGITFPCGVIVIDLDDLALIERGEPADPATAKAPPPTRNASGPPRPANNPKEPSYDPRP